ncbi:putative E3 ubiquitin-protein ligase LRSAM1 [Apostichopus japonicus]|uniref:Putative E3 ubiquitin-protein ligase LRSAM1 n=1 Tax=Stichopus japonicus TaxID=307972 RepID=A0A2G8KRS4_STIJA|nr:putative E3 ubiquitin-protein ligase LRSAM1 [Apostichopus japonicus]
MNEPLQRSESCINSDCKSWKDEHKDSFFTEGEGISVKRKPQNRPFAGRKTSLDNEIIGSSSGQKFRRSYSTSYDVNESGRRTNSSRLGSSRKSDSDDEKVNPDICSNFRRRSQDLEEEAKNYNIQQDRTFSIRSEDNSSHQAAKSFASAAVDFKDRMDRPFLGTGMLGRSPERKSKQSVRPDRFGVDDIFKKFSIPSRDFFEDEFFASDWKRHRLIEEIGGIQRNLADITKRELGKRRNTQEDQLKHEKQTKEGGKQDKKCRLGEDGEEEEEARCNKTDERIEIVQRDGEDEVSFVLRRAGADDFIPIVKKNEITIDRLYQLMPSDFIELGIADPEIQRRLQEEIDRHFVEQKNAQLKAASLERPTNDSQSKNEKEEDVEGNKELGEPCTPISSAPEGYEPEVPVHVSAECVVCMDNQSNLLFLNCGHVCCCYDCAISLSLCPLCRSEIASKLIMNDSLPDASEL